jgi:hypothetical protein
MPDMPNSLHTQTIIQFGKAFWMMLNVTIMGETKRGTITQKTHCCSEFNVSEKFWETQG